MKKVTFQFDEPLILPRPKDCENCIYRDVIFSVVWNNNGYTTGVEFCPFCGAEFDE